ncbi:MAG: 3-[(3aS,4S,7aS)-7a-methyl-1,5-dioxo-octahydro-1H-inden-4-yl]propanoyl:CoA ligase [Alphaproteobacteria bacterium MarineAlpha4_Bin2]|nr:MAG: 3-[(3aS,4S,7aS)-7a-methyl-1,5-dioxo-octahydro-1H-inden-4-yl]propanoyl:CoA ligase [Alphaproteobacteria bacterium MarineAlpha4_Bin2]
MYEFDLSESLAPRQRDMKVREITIGGLLREVSAKVPEGVALVEVSQGGMIERSWTYAAMLKDSEHLAYALSSRFEPGERVVVWSPNSPEWVFMEYACALAGLVLVTANPSFKTKELRYVLKHSGAVALFTVKNFRGNPMAQIASDAAQGLHSVREIADLEEGKALFACQSTAKELPTVSPNDAAQIQYTSGTTGFPKGAVLSHRGLVNNARYYASRCGADSGSAWINIMPMFHTSGCGMVTLGCLQAGCCMILVGLFDPHAVLDLIESEQGTILLGVPTMVVALLEAYDSQPRDISSLQVVSSGGSMVAPELVRRVQSTFGCGFSTLYGQTEHSPVITQHHLTDSVDDICNTAGQPLPQTDVSIRSIGENVVLPVGTVGEICARGPSKMIEYHEDPEATAETIDPEGWLHTGDLGTMDSRGYVRITGRVKEMIIRGGENHFPVEIENVLLEHPHVSEAAVVGLPDDKWGEIIACFVRSNANRPLDASELHSYCRKHMSAQKTPVVWCQVAEFPLTGSGKIQKFILRDRFLAGDCTPLESS